MVPAESHPSWAKLIQGDINYRFQQSSANMLFFNLRAKHRKDPSALKECIGEARSFFAKYENVLIQDIKAIFN